VAAAEDRRAIIVGAGPAGLSAAVGLGRVGIPADVFEQQSQLPRVGLGIGIQSNALRALIRLGLGDALRGKGVVMDRTEVRTNTGRLLMQMPQGEVSREFGTPTISLTRQELQDVLVGGLDQTRVHFGTRCVGVEQDDAGAIVRFADGRQERGALVIGADGARSVVAKEVLASSDPEYSGFTSWRGVLKPESPLIPDDVGVLYVGRGKVNVMFPVGGANVYFGFLLKAPPRAPAPTALQDELRRSFSDFSDATQALIDQLDPEELVQTDIYDRIPGDTWYRGRVVLTGDAMHPTTPFVGQGAGIAIEDSVVLAQELALPGGLESREAIEFACRAYQRRRIERARWIVQTGRRRGRLFSVQSRGLALGRDLLLRALPASTSRSETERLLSADL
jgi:2-polyprenyl-6-methoxyphenol hydroxylase-like FAD-dependent oxidoreductase